MIDVETYAAAKSYTDSHGGGGGTTNYNSLDNKPQINGEELSGNKTASDLGLVAAVAGKGLSTNDYDDTEKGKVADNTAAIEAMINVTGSCNLFKPYYDSSKTDGDVTWTVNSDLTIRAVGTNSGSSWKDFRLYGAVGDLKPVSGLFPCAGTYKISCEGADTGTYNIGFTIMDGSTVVISEAVPPSGKEYTITDAMMSMTCRIEISIAPGMPTPFDVTFKPMLYDARLTPTGYVPYAMTNRELTERMTWQKVTVTKSSSTYDVGAWNYSGYRVPTGYTPISVYFTGDEELASQFAIALSTPGIVRFCNASTSQKTTALTYCVLCVKI